MSEKDEDYRRKELALQERHSRELAQKSKALAEDMAQLPSGAGEVDGDEGSGAASGRERAPSKARLTVVLSLLWSSADGPDCQGGSHIL